MGETGGYSDRKNPPVSLHIIDWLVPVLVHLISSLCLLVCFTRVPTVLSLHNRAKRGWVTRVTNVVTERGNPPREARTVRRGRAASISWPLLSPVPSAFSRLTHDRRSSRYAPSPYVIHLISPRRGPASPDEMDGRRE